MTGCRVARALHRVAKPWIVVPAVVVVVMGGWSGIRSTRSTAATVIATITRAPVADAVQVPRGW